MSNVELYGNNRIRLNSEVKSMPNIESAIKRVRTSEAANAKNSSQMSAMRTTVKKFE
ncbi:MAG: 30S ribosomal protein S20, partial [Enterococcus sp.]|nr:30S ribosomal protein S20 [Enterococcus sp.]